jgi:MFS family permease
MAPAPPAIQRRLIGVLFAGTGLARTGFIATITVGSLIAEDLLGSASLAGLPAATATIGVAVGTAPIAALMARYGRRAGVSGGMGLAALGALIAAAAIGLDSFAVFVAGMFAFGFGNAGDRLSRYAAADVSPPQQRSFAISIVVWAGTIGAVLGPLLLEPTERLAEDLGLAGLAGPVLLGTAAAAVGALIAFIGLRPDPLSFVDPAGDGDVEASGSVGSLLRLPAVRYAIVALVIGQVVMVLIMTMTPVYIRRAGDGLGIVGLVIGAHTFGMFAVSPLTGWFSDRFGRLAVMIAGQIVLAVSALTAATAGGDETVLLVVALFLLGLGWNFGFVAGSAYLTEQALAMQRVQLQGVADAMVWTSGAAASLSSGFFLEAWGFAALSLTGAALAAVPMLLLFRYRTMILTRHRVPERYSAR